MEVDTYLNDIMFNFLLEHRLDDHLDESLSWVKYLSTKMTNH